jgi:hypothetical protein
MQRSIANLAELIGGARQKRLAVEESPTSMPAMPERTAVLERGRCSNVSRIGTYRTTSGLSWAVLNAFMIV